MGKGLGYAVTVGANSLSTIYSPTPKMKDFTRPSLGHNVRNVTMGLLTFKRDLPAHRCRQSENDALLFLINSLRELLPTSRELYVGEGRQNYFQSVTAGPLRVRH